MTLHPEEWSNPPQRSEVVLPPPSGLAAVLVVALFALSLSGVGVIFHLIFGRGKKHG